MPYIGKKLKELRAEKKLTQQQLADELSLSTSAIIQYENNNREPNFESIIKIEHFFGISAACLTEDFSGGMKVELPKKEYVHIEENGRNITYCTMRQKALHTVGFNSCHVGRRLYTRNGKKYYKPYRNYFCGRDKDLDKLVEAGYMDFHEYDDNGEKGRTYWFNRSGLNWLGEQIGVIIQYEVN